MSFDNSDIIEKAEAILASAKSFNGDRGERHELMKQVNLLYSDLEDPMDASELLQHCFVSSSKYSEIFSLQAVRIRVYGAIESYQKTDVLVLDEHLDGRQYPR